MLIVALAVAFAQTAPAAPAAAPHAGHATTAAKFTTDTPIETLVADPAAKAVVEAHIPGIEAHPAYDQFKAMSLKQVAPMSGGRVTDDTLAKIQTGLAAIK